MYRSFHRKFHRHNVILHPGEFKVSDEDIIISTVLGSCISVSLFDPVKEQGGMNHFLLPKLKRVPKDEKMLIKDETRYGVYAMEVLINSMMKLGSRKSDLEAKVFGGSDMFKAQNKAVSIGGLNSDFAMKFLKNEGIPVISSDTGGHLGRKILFFPLEGRILLKKLESNRKIRHIAEDEKKFDDSLIPRKKTDDIVLF